MRSAEFVLALLIAVSALVTIARRLGIAYPIFLVIGGLLLGLVPGLPRPHVEPDLIFLLVLPPILYTTAFFTPLRSLGANLGNISSLAIGLIIATAGAVAVVAHALIAGITWPVALALGAIVAPSDSIAAAAIVARLAVPRRIVTLLEGESLLNDATALTIYRIAVAAAVGGALSWTGALTTFAIAGVGGWAIGLAVGWVIAQIRTRIEDTPVEITISLLTPYAAFLPAEQLGASGVIATVVAGLYLGRRGSHIMGADARLTGRAVWETITFLLYGFVFILTGLEMPQLLRSLTPSAAIQLVGIGVAVTGVLVAVRALWIFGTAYVPPLLRGRPRTPHLFAHSLVLSWAGMRGVVSLAVALALPLLPPGRRAVPGARGTPRRDADGHRAHAPGTGADAAVAHSIASTRRRPSGPRRRGQRHGRSSSRPPRGGSISSTRCGRGTARCSIGCGTRIGTVPSTSSGSAIRRPTGRIESSSSTARSGARSSTRSARRSCAFGPRARSTTT